MSYHFEQYGAGQRLVRDPEEPKMRTYTERSLAMMLLLAFIAGGLSGGVGAAAFAWLTKP